MVQIGLDGVMIRMKAEKIGDEVTEEVGWREVSCGVVTVRDDDGNRLQSRYMCRLPEGKKQSLKTQIRKEVKHLRSQNPDLKLVVTADGANDNWTFSKASNPMLKCSISGMPQSISRVLLMPLMGPMKKASTKWFEAKRHILRHDPKGVDKVMDALRYLLGSVLIILLTLPLFLIHFKKIAGRRTAWHVQT